MAAADQLPQDVLADVLARLPPRNLAASRAVCREWRAAADARCRLRADLLPISVGGIFVASNVAGPPDFFARPSTAARGFAGGRLEHYVVPARFVLSDDFPRIVDCCNGLLLLEEDYEDQVYVVNPATKEWARLPPFPADFSEGNEGFGSYDDSPYLVFDPTLSPHYDAVVAMQIPFDCNGILSEGLEWPPSLYIMRVYSSRTGRWEERHFALEERFQGSIDGVRWLCDGRAAYWHGALYVQCNSHFVMRINLSDDKYRLIKLPSGFNARVDHEFYLGKSKGGIHFATVTNYEERRLLIWFVDESADRMKWVLKRSISARAVIQHFWNNPHDQTDRPWILQDYGFDQENNKGPNTPTVEENLDWESDDDGAIYIKDCDDKLFGTTIFGFHPYKQIVFLHHSRVLAYHFDSSKVQDLGELDFKYPGHKNTTPFIYTPCQAGELSGNN
ncbi:unnamed protein product [Urochloa decumbens]|uniref:F-box domain-containing protein n=1 Tax=Urochloa decumbens TaxID=240449 RepID=A0ABC8Y0H0_9POAL